MLTQREADLLSWRVRETRANPDYDETEWVSEPGSPSARREADLAARGLLERVGSGYRITERGREAMEVFVGYRSYGDSPMDQHNHTEITIRRDGSCPACLAVREGWATQGVVGDPWWDTSHPQWWGRESA